MRTLLLFVIIFYVIVFNGCTDGYAGKCKEIDHDQAGYSFAKNSYKDFGEFAIFGFNKEFNNNSIIYLTLMNLDAYCYYKEYIGLRIIPCKLHDTIFIHPYLNSVNDFPSGKYIINDYDAIIEQYDILEGKGLKNWVYIDYIDPDTTYIEGRFNLSFVTTYEPYLSGKRERWDDPNRPDTLHFTNGEFKAVLSQ